MNLMDTYLMIISIQNIRHQPMKFGKSTEVSRRSKSSFQWSAVKVLNVHDTFRQIWLYYLVMKSQDFKRRIHTVTNFTLQLLYLIWSLTLLLQYYYYSFHRNSFSIINISHSFCTKSVSIIIFTNPLHCERRFKFFSLLSYYIIFHDWKLFGVYNICSKKILKKIISRLKRWTFYLFFN